MALTEDQKELRVKSLEKLLLTVKNEGKKEAAAFYRKAIVAMFKVQGFTEENCKSCGKKIWFVWSKNDKRIPYTVDGTSHFSDCPQANQHRRKR